MPCRGLIVISWATAELSKSASPDTILFILSVTNGVLTVRSNRYFLIYEGINDIGHANDSAVAQTLRVHRMIIFYKQIITRVHTLGIPVFGGTISPFMCPPGEPAENNLAEGPIRESTRLAVNDWIRTSGWFDAVVDFDEILKSPKNSTLINPAFNVGDCLHFNDAGNDEIAAKFPIEILREFKNGVHKIQ